MKIKEKKALWFPRSLLLISFLLLFTFSALNRFVGYGELILLINCIMLFVFIISFFQPIVSGLFYIICSSVVLYGLYTVYLGKVLLILLNFNVIPFAFWLIFISGVFLILIDLFPNMFDGIEFTKW
jgi:hypothetical protein